MSDDQKVILVDEKDREIGLEDKMKAHQNGAKLHRAFSVFVFNKNGETLMQQRAATKYHGALLWSNTCCSHPFPGEDVLHAAHRRLGEELGFDCEMMEAFSFTYHVPMDKGLSEWEFDHVVFGFYDGKVKPNRDEVETTKWVSLEELKRDVTVNPSRYSPWLRICIDKVISAHKEADG